MKQTTSWLHTSLRKVTTIHFIFGLLYAGQIVVYDAWKLITPQVVLERWIASALLLVINTFVWYLARSQVTSPQNYKLLIWALIVADIAFASFNVYTQRGMASRAVAMYAVPIIISAILASRAALLATASLCIIAYTSTAVAYFVLNFNEGYKIELYGEVGWYSLLFLLLAVFLWVVVRHRQHPTRN